MHPLAVCTPAAGGAPRLSGTLSLNRATSTPAVGKSCPPNLSRKYSHQRHGSVPTAAPSLGHPHGSAQHAESSSAAAQVLPSATSLQQAMDVLSGVYCTLKPFLEYNKLNCTVLVIHPYTTKQTMCTTGANKRDNSNDKLQPVKKKDPERPHPAPQPDLPNMLDTFDNATVYKPARPAAGASIDTWKDYLDSQLDSLLQQKVLGGLVVLPGRENRIHGGAL